VVAIILPTTWDQPHVGSLWDIQNINKYQYAAVCALFGVGDPNLARREIARLQPQRKEFGECLAVGDVFMGKKRDRDVTLTTETGERSLFTAKHTRHMSFAAAQTIARNWVRNKQFRDARSEASRRSAMSRKSTLQLARAISEPTGWLSAPMSAAPAAAALVRGARFTNLAAGPSRDELKYLDVNYGNSVADTTGLVTLMNGVATGSTAITREGRQCVWRSVEVHGLLMPVDSTISDSRCDIYVIYDQQPGAAVPAMTDLFVESIAGSPHNLNYRDRFRTLAHQVFTLGKRDTTATQTFSASPGPMPVDIYKRLAIKSTFKGDGNAIGDIATGAIYLVTLGSNAAAACGTFYINTRLRFTEK